jgi:phosphohistidine phosphatase SixA
MKQAYPLGMPVTLRALAGALVSVLLAGSPALAAGNEALWALLRAGGQVVLLRHGATDMEQRDQVGAPLSDCARQRNLNEDGREDARLIGAVFRVRAIPVGRVLSSAYCRCLETAQLAFGRAEAWTALQQALTNKSVQEARIAEIRAVVGERPTDGNLVLVTHQYPIRLLTGVKIAEGEMLILTPRGNGQFEIAGRIPPEELSDP